MVNRDFFAIAKKYADKSGCLKNKVGAIIVKEGVILGGGCNQSYPIAAVCPRESLGYSGGEGYDLCRSRCNQSSHAEVSAIQDTLGNHYPHEIMGSVCYIVGHHRCCPQCMRVLDDYGITEVRFG